MAAGFSLMAAQLDGLPPIPARRNSPAQAPALDAASDLDAGCGVLAGRRQRRVWSRRSPWPGPSARAIPNRCWRFPDLRVAFADVVGGDHVKLRLVGGDGARLDAIAFRAVGTPLGEGLLAVAGTAHPCRRAAAQRRLERPRPASSCRSRMRRRQAPEDPRNPALAKTAQRPCIAPASGCALRLSVRTQDFHSCKRGSTPLGRTISIRLPCGRIEMPSGARASAVSAARQGIGQIRHQVHRHGMSH